MLICRPSKITFIAGLEKEDFVQKYKYETLEEPWGKYRDSIQRFPVRVPTSSSRPTAVQFIRINNVLPGLVGKSGQNSHLARHSQLVWQPV